MGHTNEGKPVAIISTYQDIEGLKGQNIVFNFVYFIIRNHLANIIQEYNTCVHRHTCTHTCIHTLA